MNFWSASYQSKVRKESDRFLFYCTIYFDFVPKHGSSVHLRNFILPIEEQPPFLFVNRKLGNSRIHIYIHVGNPGSKAKNSTEREKSGRTHQAIPFIGLFKK